MNITIYQISKSIDNNTKAIIDNYIKMSKIYATVKLIKIYDKDIKQSQKLSVENIKKSYTRVYKTKLKMSFNIALDMRGKVVDSLEFSEYFQDQQNVNFFIGGAYGFDDEFLRCCDAVVSLSSMTISHKIVPIVLCEQVYRAITIITNHPYHK
ncbi:MAG: hypothetical protein B1H07_01880 [Campylobacteraceae bacterium 4484_166]|nr:MAG: hypothetical protein B1H07_01880 [Campylobacteraceae bacterium 4484_166]